MNRFTLYRYPVICGLLVSLIILLATGWIWVLKSEQQQQLQRTRILSHLSNTRGRLEAVLNSRLLLVQGLVALVESRQEISEEKFQQFARSLARVEPGIRSLQLAPDAVVGYVFPREGNEQIIGHDLRADPNRFPAAQRAISEKKFFITGPVDLIQGGTALIARQPIFLKDLVAGEKFWGFATILLDVEPLLREGGMLDPSSWVEYALRGKDGLGAMGSVIYGRAEVFQEDAILLDVTLPEGSWQLAAIPAKGWQRGGAGTSLILYLGALLAITCGRLSSLSLSRKQKLKSDNDRLEHQVLVRTDVLKRSNRQLQCAVAEKTSLQGRLQDMIDSMPSIILSIDDNGIITQWNRAAEQTTGIDAATALGTQLSVTLPELALELTGLDLHGQQGVPAPKGSLCLSLQGTIRSYEMTVFPIKGETAGGTVIRLDDISDRIRMQEFIIQSEKIQSVGGLAAGMAHEINNPLAGILQNLEVINMRLSPTQPKNLQVASQCGVDLERVNDYFQQRKISKMLQGAQESGKRAAKIVETMLDFSRKGNFAPEPHSLVRLIEMTLELIDKDYNLKSNYNFRKIEIEKDFGPGLPLVSCDASQIQQVLFNLLKNGAQAMAGSEERGRPPRIVIRTRVEGGMARIEVEDNGLGMDELTQKRIFEPFYTTKEAGVGTGLGLSICFFIITQNHNGTMEVESSPGQGAKFVIRLPRAYSAGPQGEYI